MLQEFSPDIQGIILEDFFLPRIGGVLGATQPPLPVSYLKLWGVALKGVVFK